MISTQETRMPTSRKVLSLVWDGDDLVDWADGGQKYLMTGELVPRHVDWRYPFDAAVASPSGEFAVTYNRLGTNGLVLQKGTIIREIHRSSYCADRYEYPITVVRLKSGREVLALCPQEYCQLEIEDLKSGERLTRHQSRKPSDFFHSRLVASPDGALLISAGWLWHPVDEVRVYDIEAALADSSVLDGNGFNIDAWAEESSATFDCDGRVIVALNRIEVDEEEDRTETSRSAIRIFDLQRSSAPKVLPNTGCVGTVMAIGRSHILGLYNHPRLIDVESGKVVQSWIHIRTGYQVSSILRSSPPPIALDPKRRRIAVADETGITVLRFPE